MNKDLKAMSRKVNIGCGRTPTEGWLNFDNSPAIKLARSPLKYSLAKALGLLNQEQLANIEWNKENNIHFADASKSIPLEDSSVDCIYTSHMIEHLSQEGARNFLNEAIRVLKVGGIVRIAVPDLRIAVNEYLKHNDADAFMNGILVKAPEIKTLRQKFILFVSGYRHHQWMYDGASLSKLLLEIGFASAEICKDGKTNIGDYGNLNLYEREDDSVYVEAIK
ncbi:methyltransferase domain-containing protein [Rhodobacterales bacterium FZCC0069]|nr:methyltransferase domain-containing protein [Rhodobacterales bacterium FZCC0069]